MAPRQAHRGVISVVIPRDRCGAASCDEYRTTIASAFSQVYIREQFLSVRKHEDTAWRHRDEAFSKRLQRQQRRSA
jgi:hypothetical protein